ncbi:MAG: sel1 repeat family protein, partial [Rhodobacteraceae bacterium]|nr:sel1 repeat family protein [Paracoccaceae bacterium]MYF45550.1 sel1 repeat family protein [Paracoccaceae bacterium]
MGYFLVFRQVPRILASTQDINVGVEAYKRGDYETALREWHPLAEQGEVEAQFILGLMYGNGEGVPQDYGEAEKWWRLSAEQG